MLGSTEVYYWCDIYLVALMDVVSADNGVYIYIQWDLSKMVTVRQPPL